ncbi:hypothetical protein BKP42_63310 [Rhodococcus erythropolis]|nr:hypothetical protein BKP42_63310 [Rhodococcus erythropolis]
MKLEHRTIVRDLLSVRSVTAHPTATSPKPATSTCNKTSPKLREQESDHSYVMEGHFLRKYTCLMTNQQMLRLEVGTEAAWALSGPSARQISGAPPT